MECTCCRLEAEFCLVGCREGSPVEIRSPPHAVEVTPNPRANFIVCSMESLTARTGRPASLQPSPEKHRERPRGLESVRAVKEHGARGTRWKRRRRRRAICQLPPRALSRQGPTFLRTPPPWPLARGSHVTNDLRAPCQAGLGWGLTSLTAHAHCEG